MSKFIQTDSGDYINTDHIVRTKRYKFKQHLATVDLADGSTDLVYLSHLKDLAFTYLPNALPVKAVAIFVNDDGTLVVESTLVVAWRISARGEVAPIYDVEQCNATFCAYETSDGLWTCTTITDGDAWVEASGVSYDDLLSEVKASALRGGIIQEKK